MLLSHRLLLAFFLLVATQLPAAECPPPGTAPLKFAHQQHACTTLPDGRVLVTGGLGTNAAEIYDPATDSSTIAGAMSMARWAHTATVLTDGRVLIAGGKTFQGAASELELFDPASNQFSPSPGATLLRDGGVRLPSGQVIRPAPVAVAYTRTIDFSGRTWLVKSSGGSKVGPGPNLFSDDPLSVWVDAAGLHMKIRKIGPKWYCSEVICTTSLGYGTYRFSVDTPVDNLDPQVVLGLFTWSDTPDFNNREIDIEFSRWGNKNNQYNAQYVVQPYTDPQNIYHFQEPAGLLKTIHSFFWQIGSVYFESIDNYTPGGPYTIASKTIQSPSVPPQGDEHARINLWLYQGRAPTNRKDVEVVISKFEFQ